MNRTRSVALSLVLVIAVVPTAAAQDAIDGRQVFDQQHCRRCHAIAGDGNRHRALDDIGARRSADEIRAFVTGDPASGGQFNSRAIAAKKKNAALPPAQINALVQYLSTLRGTPP